VYVDDFIQATLDRLKEQDQSWEAVEVSQLRNLLRAEWRTAGNWSLVAESRDARLATQAAETWGEVVFEKVSSAVKSASDLILTDYQMEVTAQGLAQASARLQQVETSQEQMKQWVAAAKSLPADEPLEADERWLVISKVAGLANFDPGWLAILADQPDETAPRQTIINWLEQVLSLIETEIPMLKESISEFENKQIVLNEQYREQFDLSLGLSPNLEIEKIELVPTERVQPVGLMTLLGGVSGLLLWIFKELVRINNHLRTDEQAKPDLAAE